MKRLLAAGSGSIYQICKAFRNGEAGRFHNPEFTILEWYRVGFGLQALMDEVAELLMSLLRPFLPNLSIKQTSYQDIVRQLIDLDPLVFDRQAYQQVAIRLQSPEAEGLCGDDHALWLDFLFSHHVQTRLPQNTICLVHGYPAIQSSLARIHPEDARVSERFEVFINGLELGNGFFELKDADEQARRFAKEIAQRQVQGLVDVTMDERFLQALQAGLPDCSGVAIGLDRLLMIATGCEFITQVLAFPIGIA
jgi:lysyl-tRNA synthetase class 2